jgi:nitrite reductase/ring-hydroxylating ferredoxin subunit
MSKLTRREFLRITNRFLTVTGLAVIFGPIIAYFYPAKLEEVPSDPVLAGPEDELPPGASKTIRFGRYPALVINTSEGLRAYSAVCTHFACLVKYDLEQDTILCPCHDGFFDPLNGEVISGPPPTPLEPFKVEVVDGQIYVGGAE